MLVDHKSSRGLNQLLGAALVSRTICVAQSQRLFGSIMAPPSLSYTVVCLPCSLLDCLGLSLATSSTMASPSMDSTLNHNHSCFYHCLGFFCHHHLYFPALHRGSSSSSSTGFSVTNLTVLFCYFPFHFSLFLIPFLFPLF